MRTWIKATVAGASLLALGVLALAGTAGYFVFKGLEKTTATEAAAIREMDGIKARFGARPPLVEIINPRSMDVRVNRLASSDGARVQTIHVVNWWSLTTTSPAPLVCSCGWTERPPSTFAAWSTCL
jgi:hypothetical protein